MKIAKYSLLFGALFAFLAVALGAFAAHGLKNSLSEYALSIFQTGVQYQMTHALALLALGLWGEKNPGRKIQLIFYAFCLGILLFSVSLYALAFTGIKTLGMITPLGGLLFLLAWILWAWQIFKDIKSS